MTLRKWSLFFAFGVSVLGVLSSIVLLLINSPKVFCCFLVATLAAILTLDELIEFKGFGYRK